VLTEKGTDADKDHDAVADGPTGSPKTQHVGRGNESSLRELGQTASSAHSCYRMLRKVPSAVVIEQIIVYQQSARARVTGYEKSTIRLACFPGVFGSPSESSRIKVGTLMAGDGSLGQTWNGVEGEMPDVGDSQAVHLAQVRDRRGTAGLVASLPASVEEVCRDDTASNAGRTGIRLCRGVVGRRTTSQWRNTRGDNWLLAGRC
jgi:hypothetical protein